MKIKLFTHTDLDGVGCAIVACHAFGPENVDVEYCNYDEIDEKVRDFTASMQFIHFDKVYITDISINRDVAELIEYSICEKREFLDRYRLLDHHNTAKWLNEYNWAYVNDFELSIYPKERRMKSCGTSLFYNHLWEHENVDLPHLLVFIEKVRRYDTWEWSTKFNDSHSKQLNDLFFLISREKFINRFIDNPSVTLTNSEELILEIEQQRINYYIESKKKEMFEDDLDGYRVGVVFNESYHSQLGEELAKTNEHLDFIVMINVGSGKVSYRGIHPHIDLGEIAGNYGGGGHPKAAGSESDPLVRRNLWRSYLNK